MFVKYTVVFMPDWIIFGKLEVKMANLFCKREKTTRERGKYNIFCEKQNFIYSRVSPEAQLR